MKSLRFPLHLLILGALPLPTPSSPTPGGLAPFNVWDDFVADDPIAKAYHRLHPTEHLHDAFGSEAPPAHPCLSTPPHIQIHDFNVLIGPANPPEISLHPPEAVPWHKDAPRNVSLGFTIWNANRPAPVLCSGETPGSPHMFTHQDGWFRCRQMVRGIGRADVEGDGDEGVIGTTAESEGSFRFDSRSQRLEVEGKYTCVGNGDMSVWWQGVAQMETKGSACAPVGSNNFLCRENHKHDVTLDTVKKLPPTMRFRLWPNDGDGPGHVGTGHGVHRRGRGRGREEVGGEGLVEGGEGGEGAMEVMEG